MNKFAVLFLAASMSCAAAVRSEPTEDQAAAKRLLVSAYIEGAAFCEEHPNATYVTHIGGIRIDADCKLRKQFVEWLATRGETLSDVWWDLKPSPTASTVE